MKHRRIVVVGMFCYLTPGYPTQFAELLEEMYGLQRSRTALAALNKVL